MQCRSCWISFDTDIGRVAGERDVVEKYVAKEGGSSGEVQGGGRES